jgi:hypothetical protein
MKDKGEAGRRSRNGQDKKNDEYALDLPPHGQRKEDEKVHDEDGPVYRDVEDL